MFYREQEKKEKLGTDTLPDLLSEDMYREMLRKKWETEEEEAAKRGPGPVHYQNVKFDGMYFFCWSNFTFAHILMFPMLQKTNEHCQFKESEHCEEYFIYIKAEI